MFLGNQLPLRLGEVARGVIAAREGVPLATSASSIVAERLIDTLAVVVVIALTLSQLPGALPEVTDRAALFGLVALAGFLFLLGVARFPAATGRLLDKLLQLIPPLRRLPLESIFSGSCWPACSRWLKRAPFSSWASGQLLPGYSR